MKTYRETMREMEREYLRCVLAESGSVKEAAAKAGVSRQHFHKLMRRAGMRHSVSHANRGNAAWQALAPINRPWRPISQAQEAR